MSIFGFFKRAFGFESDDIDDDPITASDNDSEEPDGAPAPSLPAYPVASDSSKAVTTTLTEARAADQSLSEATPTPDDGEPDSRGNAPEKLSGPSPTPSEPDRILADTSLANDLFGAVIELFNSALPDFLARCIDRDGQRKLLLEQLDNNLRRRLASEIDRARAQGLKAAQGKADSSRNLEQRCQEANAARLSAERQKRALAERVHDLESQVSSLEQDKESRIHETRAMQSRLRAAEVAASIAKDAPADNAPDTGTITQLNARIEQLSDDNHKLREALEQQKAQKQIADAMINSLQTAAASAREQLQAVKAEYADTGVSREEMAELEAKIEAFADIKRRKDDKIAALKEEREKLNEQISELNHTIRTNLYNHTLEEARLRQRIEHLERQLKADPHQPQAEAEAEAEPIPEPTQEPEPSPADEGPLTLSFSEAEKSPEPPAPRKRGRKRKQTISAIDNLIESSDWFSLVSESPEQPKGKSAAPDDFGYRTPPRRTLPENEDQLSLW